MASVRRMSFTGLVVVLCLVSINASHPSFTNYAALPSMIARSITTAVKELVKTKQLQKQHYVSGHDMMLPSHIKRHVHRWYAFVDSITTKPLSDKAFISVRATKELVHLTNTPLHILQSDPHVVSEWRKQIGPHCGMPVPRCNPNVRYRTADGTCNNLKFPAWGASMTQQLRILPAAYDDGINSPRQLSVTGPYLQSARVISNVLHSTDRSDVDEGGRSVLLMSWGSLTVLDILLTPQSTGFNDSDVECCPFGEATTGEMDSCFPIMVPRDDRRFRSNCMNFVRSEAAPNQLCDMDVRNQINAHTSYLDASEIYGSTQAAQNRLREGRGGFMKVSPNGLLPPAGDDTCVLSNPGEFCFDAGGPRNTLVPSFAGVFTVLVREHNRIAKQLNYYNPVWSDEKLFQEARKILVAIVQHITYNEYLPHILSDLHMRAYGLFSAPKGHQTVYNPKVNPSLTNVFGVAAMRFGHSHAPPHHGMTDPDTLKTVEVPTEFTFNRPALLLADNGRGVDKLNFWQLTTEQPRQDRFLQNAVRNELFLNEMGVAFDLAARNIQRGRDHGVASYNAWRQWCGLQPASHFGTSPGGLIHHDPHAAILLSKVYKHPDDIDLFTGGLSEVKVKGTITGPTFSCIIAKQFQSLKQGDRFWYENDIPGVGFTTVQLNEIKKVQLSKIMCVNIGIRQIQQNPLQVPSLHNRMVECELLPSIDLRHWMESPPQRSQPHPLGTGHPLNNPLMVPLNPVPFWTFIPT